MMFASGMELGLSCCSEKISVAIRRPPLASEERGFFPTSCLRISANTCVWTEGLSALGNGVFIRLWKKPETEERWRAICTGLCQPGIAVVISDCAVSCYVLKNKAQESIEYFIECKLAVLFLLFLYPILNKVLFFTENIPFSRHASSEGEAKCELWMSDRVGRLWRVCNQNGLYLSSCTCIASVLGQNAWPHLSGGFSWYYT